ncbi:hypothetical protein BDZ85DRAFT_130955 [Elsinoe ampelina]|uniref:Uncharacterized protein n=1 Tax=Elsinoe ampelina TaxID=302913 RepID=A0A6A6GAE4_9PEZI|nr:hypothetical protein BDZ85DRAFT_130955 [Elsinoe ampelina]
MRRRSRAMCHTLLVHTTPAGTCVDGRVEGQAQPIIQDLRTRLAPFGSKMGFLQADWSFQTQSLSGFSVQTAPITIRLWRLRETRRVHFAFRHTKHLQRTLHPHPVSIDIDTDTVCSIESPHA